MTTIPGGFTPTPEHHEAAMQLLRAVLATMKENRILHTLTRPADVVVLYRRCVSAVANPGLALPLPVAGREDPEPR